MLDVVPPSAVWAFRGGRRTEVCDWSWSEDIFVLASERGRGERREEEKMVVRDKARKKQKRDASWPVIKLDFASKFTGPNAIK